MVQTGYKNRTDSCILSIIKFIKFANDLCLSYNVVIQTIEILNSFFFLIFSMGDCKMTAALPVCTNCTLHDDNSRLDKQPCCCNNEFYILLLEFGILPIIMRSCNLPLYISILRNFEQRIYREFVIEKMTKKEVVYAGAPL